MVCSKCGTQNADGVQFCAGCGAPMTVPQQPMYQQPQQPMYQQPMYQQPQQPMYQPPMYPQQPAVPGKGLGVASMVVGIISLVLFCIWYIAIPCAIVGVILGGVALSKAKEVGMKNSLAVAGIACSCVALGIALLFILLGLIGAASMDLLL